MALACDNHALSLYLCNLLFFPLKPKKQQKKKNASSQVNGPGSNGIHEELHEKSSIVFRRLVIIKDPDFSILRSVAHSETTEASIWMISGEMKLMLACVFVGSVLAGKTNPYLSFFFSRNVFNQYLPL